jgi:hypothetical protein
LKVMSPMKHLIISVGVAAATALIATPVGAHEHCPDPLTQTEAIVSVQTGIFSALENEDKASWERLTDRDFVAFESGHRYGRTDFFELVRSAHAGGRRFEWSVTSPHIEVSCTLATLAYVNQGSVTQGGSRSAVSWLETATFRYAAGQWRAVFVESMREAN